MIMWRADTLPVDKEGAQAPQGVTTASSHALSGRSLPQPCVYTETESQLYTDVELT